MYYLSWRALPLALPFVALLFIFCGLPLRANETPQPSSDLLTSTIEKLLKVNVILTNLEADLMRQQKAIDELALSLQQAAQKLAESEETLAEVEKRLSASEMLRQELGSSLESLREEHERLRGSFLKLSTAFGSYKVEAEYQLSKVTKSRNVWRGIGLGAAATAVLAFLAAVL